MKYSEFETALVRATRATVTSKVPGHGQDRIAVKRVEGGYRLTDQEGDAVATAFGMSGHVVGDAAFFNKLQKASFESRGFAGATPTGSKTTANNLALDLGKPAKSVRKTVAKVKPAKARKYQKTPAPETARHLATFRANQTAMRPLEDIVLDQMLAIFGTTMHPAVASVRIREPHLMPEEKPVTVTKKKGGIHSYVISIAEMECSLPVVGGIAAESTDHAYVLVGLLAMARILRKEFGVPKENLLQLTQFESLHATFPEAAPVLTKSARVHFAAMYAAERPPEAKLLLAQSVAARAQAAADAAEAAAAEAATEAKRAVARLAPAQEQVRQATAALDEESDEDVPLSSLVRM